MIADRYPTLYIYMRTIYIYDQYIYIPYESRVTIVYVNKHSTTVYESEAIECRYS
uniref:Uncharacterized protein n=1 Tax=viral metagenome TaxID=1070528 RepID=A0A6C0LY02_9ZZZZ